MKTRILGLILVCVMLLTIPAYAMYTTMEGNDIIKIISYNPSHWAEEAINRLLEKEAFLLKDENYDTPVTKSEFAKMLSVALDIKMYYFVQPDIKDYFDDIDPEAPYASYVIDLVTANVFESGGSFNPDAYLTREEMVNYLMNAYTYIKGEEYTMIKFTEPSFDDADKISPEYIIKISQAQHYSLIFGSGNNLFNPQRNATRAEVATVIVRLMDLLDTLNLQNTQVKITTEAVMKEDNSIEMKIIIKNESENDASIEFFSGQKYDFKLLDADKNILWTWSANKLFLQVLSTMEIKAGETVEFVEVVSADEYAPATKDEVVYVHAFITGKAGFINPEGYETVLVK